MIGPKDTEIWGKMWGTVFSSQKHQKKIVFIFS